MYLNCYNPKWPPWQLSDFPLLLTQLTSRYSWDDAASVHKSRQRAEKTFSTWHVWWEVMTDCIKHHRLRGKAALDLNVFPLQSRACIYTHTLSILKYRLKTHTYALCPPTWFLHMKMCCNICLPASVGVRYLVDEKLQLENCRPTLMMAMTVHSWPSQTDDIRELRKRGQSFTMKRTVIYNWMLQGCTLNTFHTALKAGLNR